jgi:hypothetical protein
VLLSVHNYAELPLYATDIGAFTLNHRPLEYVVYPDATHQLKMPRQRLASQENTVDWMAFWLRGELPADVERADRWKTLYDQQGEVLEDLGKQGKRVAPLPTLRPSPPWAVEAWQDTHRRIGDLAPDGERLSLASERH